MVLIPGTWEYFDGNCGYLHDKGDKDCNGCWVHEPVRCYCGGLIHFGVWNDDYNFETWYPTMCDTCGVQGDVYDWEKQR